MHAGAMRMAVMYVIKQLLTTYCMASTDLNKYATVWCDKDTSCH